MITPRATRLVRASDLLGFRDALIALAGEGAPADACDRLLVLPTRTASAHLIRSIEDRLDQNGAVLLPAMCTPAELPVRVGQRLPNAPPMLTDAEREVVLGVACRAARGAGSEPPFRLRPALVAEILRFYDSLRGHQRDIDSFERLALGTLEPGAAYDRGAERLVRQTRFLVAAFRDFQHRCAAIGADDVHALRARLIATPAERPYRHVVVAVGDYAFDRHGLVAADWDLLARLPGLARLDVVITDRALAGAPHERVHQLLPGIEEVRFDAISPAAPVLLKPAGDGGPAHVARDREEEVAAFARRVKHGARRGEVTALDRVALVVRQPLPYVYVAREVLRAAGVPSQTFDALPLAAEPYAAALDLVFAAVSGGFARGPSVALLQSPHFIFRAATPFSPTSITSRDVAALDRALSEAGYLGEMESLDRLIAGWRDRQPARGALTRALRAAAALRAVGEELAPLRVAAPAGRHLSVLRSFLAAHDAPPASDHPLRERQLRARGAILATLDSLGRAYERFDDAAVEFDEVAATVRRWIEGQTFAPRAGTSGVHIVDAASAPFGEFDEVQLAGVVEGEWPEPPRRNIFYAPSLLRDLGWPAEADRIEGVRAAFVDLLRLPAARLVVSAFSLEADALVSVSPLVDEAEVAALPAIEVATPALRVFEDEALALDPLDTRALATPIATWAEQRRGGPAGNEARFRGFTSPRPVSAWSVSALERYQDCPFRFFAGDVLRLQESPEDEASLSPRARGRFIHEVFQRFFAAWDASGQGTITVDRLDAAREVFARVAEPLLAALPEAEAGLERTRLFGSAISVGILDIVLGVEAARPATVRERLLEHQLEGTFALGLPSTTVALKGVADRIDLLDGRRLRVVDYKSGSAPNPRRALQVAIYALCAQEQLAGRDGAPWTIDEAAYVVFTGKRPLVTVVKAGSTAPDALPAARRRLLDIVAGIGRGDFPPRPYDPMICRSCAFASVCRKDYVADA